MAVGMIAGMASKKKERPNQLSLVGALSAVAVYFGWKLFNNRPRSTDGNSNIFDIQSNRSSSVDEAENQPENNTVLELLQEKDDRGDSGSAPFKGKQDGQFLSKSDDLNSGCDYLSNTVLESLQENDGRGESGSAPFKEKQDRPFLSKSEGLNSSCNYLFNIVLESLQENDDRGESGSAPFNEKQEGPFLSKSEDLYSGCDYLSNTVLESLQENDDIGESGSAPFKEKLDEPFLSKSEGLNSGCNYLFNIVLESLQENDDKGESGSTPFKEKQDGPFQSESEGLNSGCNYLSTDDWKHYCSAISSDSPVSRPQSSPSSTLLNCELVDGDDIVLFGSTLRSEVAQCANNGAMRGHSKIHSEADADLDRCLSSSSLSSISLESSIENPQNGEGAINASLPLRLHVYDEYLSDPCLSPSMRSQVLRAKSIVQRLQKS